ncbi:hypothetical protein [Janibacter cremeus]|uniref:Uncharacterized protein n=1 Tax=Janibacter cremeus TaxID=1285192 RepID=A0A852VKC7_9MICO|nr:hypothetical protein [Janibacter cremeus]NYF97557.1 hypothetical protein [Janibacter cremeus]
MQPMTIASNRFLAIALMVIGALLLIISLLDQQWISVVAGAVLALLGVLTFINPLIKVEPDEVQVRNPLGMTLKRFPVTSPADLALEGKTLRHVPTGKRITSLGFGVHGPDADALRTQLSGQS